MQFPCHKMNPMKNVTVDLNNIKWKLLKKNINKKID
ncbi:hypothetical protein NEOC95_002011 [Neochlamydia sp. AcF95]|nr:hypothetical protein [Neochlamydia sp. AcF95]